MTKTKSFTAALKRWESLADNSEDKLHYLAIHDGDREKAKWAFLRDKTEQKVVHSRSSEEFASISSRPDVTKGFVKKFELQLNKLFNGLPLPIRNLTDGNCRFWALWLGLVLFPNIAFKTIMLAPQFHQDPSFARMTINTFCVFSILAFVILIKSFLKMTSRGEKFRQFAAIILLVTLANFLLNLPLIVEMNSNESSANSSIQTSYDSAQHVGSGLVLVGEQEEKCAKKVNRHLKFYLGSLGDYAVFDTHQLDKWRNQNRKPSSMTGQIYGNFKWKIEQVKTIYGWEWSNPDIGEYAVLDVLLEGILFANPNAQREYAYEDAIRPLVRVGFNTNTYKVKRLRYYCEPSGILAEMYDELKAETYLTPYTDKKRFFRFLKTLVSF